mgnify:CR=1 FL=1
MIQFGLRLHDAEKLPIEQVLPLVRQKGFSCVHLALSKSLKEVPNTPSALTPATRPICAVCLQKMSWTLQCWATT